MLPLSVLSKMRCGIGLATLTLVGCSSGGTEEQVKAPVPPVVEKIPDPLTAEQIATLNKLLPDLVSNIAENQQKAFNTIFGMGKGAIEPLMKASSASQDVPLQRRINYLIRYIKAGGDPCPGCGMG